MLRLVTLISLLIFYGSVSGEATYAQTSPPTPTPRPSDFYSIFDVGWSPDGSLFYVLGYKSLVSFGTDTFNVRGEIAYYNDIRQFYSALYPTGDDVYLLRTPDIASAGVRSGSIAVVHKGSEISSFSITADGQIYGFLDRDTAENKIFARFYAADTRALLRQIELPFAAQAGAMALSPDGTMIAISQTGQEGGAQTETVHILPFDENGDIPFVSTIQTVQPAARLAFAHDAGYLIAVSARGDIERFAPDGERQSAVIRTESLAASRITGLAISPDNASIAITEHSDKSNFGALRIYDIASMTQVFAVYAEHGTNRINGAAYSPDGRYLAIGNLKIARIFDTATFEEVMSLEKWPPPCTTPLPQCFVTP